MKFFIFSCIALLGFQTFGDSETFHPEFVSIYKRLPENIETANLKWRLGLSYFANKNQVIQIPLLAELKMPFSIQTPHIRWLIQMGGGWMQSYHKVCNPFFIPAPSEPSFNNEFFKRITEKRLEKNTNEKTCWKKWQKNKSFPYFLVQPGLMYDFDTLTGWLRAGILLGGPETVGAVASLSIGSDWWDFGIQTLYYDRLYFGIVLTVGSTLQNWQVKNPYKTNPEDIN